MRAVGISARLVVIAGITAVLVTCAHRPDSLTRVGATGVLNVGAVRSALPLGSAAGGAPAFDKAIASRWAKSLDAQVRVRPFDTQKALRRAVAAGAVDFGMAASPAPESSARLRATPVYRQQALVVVYNRDRDKPESLAALSGQLVLSGDTAIGPLLAKHQPPLDYSVLRTQTGGELLRRVAKTNVRATIVTRSLAKRYRRYYPKLAIAFAVKNAREHSLWLFKRAPNHRDDALYNKAVAFLRHEMAHGGFKHLRDTTLEYGADLGPIGRRAFGDRVDARLRQWRSDFKIAAIDYGIDWRLLAAISYQESQWRPDAVSSTRVRGLMMLTRAAAHAVGIKNRRDPLQSIDGGAKYFLREKQRLPAAVKPPDRTWFALAAYNAGFGAVMDARRLLKRQGKDPNRWINLRQALLLLEKPAYAKNAANGRANGRQAVTYVAHIRAYFDMLRWLSTNSGGRSSVASVSADANIEYASAATLPTIRSPLF